MEEVLRQILGIRSTCEASHAARSCAEEITSSQSPRTQLQCSMSQKQGHSVQPSSLGVAVTTYRLVRRRSSYRAMLCPDKATWKTRADMRRWVVES